MLNPVNLEQKVSGKGGLWGKIAGAALGLGAAAAAPFTAGTSLAALPIAGGLAAGAAPMIGEAIDPQKVSGGKGGDLLSSAIKSDPELQNALMGDAQSALKDIPGMSLEDQKMMHDQFEVAKQRNAERIRLAMGGRGGTNQG